MPVSPSLNARLVNGHQHGAPVPKVGLDIVAGTDYPSTWDGMIGQEQAKEHLQTAIMSARVRKARLDHILLASGLAGIGKTTLAQIIGVTCGTGFVAVSGAMTVDDARTVLMSLPQYGILFWDEFHLAVAGNKNRADWLLPVLTDHTLLTKAGPEPMPDITVIAATTDVGKLPETILGRFMLRPRLTEYTDPEASSIASALAKRLKVEVTSHHHLRQIAKASNNNPREMRVILSAVRDLLAVNGYVDLVKAFDWVGVTEDGIGQAAQDMLLVLLGSPKHTLSIDNIAASLSEPGPLRHQEKYLLRRGFVTVTGQGRTLTDAGVERARELVRSL